MRIRLAWILGAWLLGASRVCAQTPAMPLTDAPLEKKDQQADKKVATSEKKDASTANPLDKSAPETPPIDPKSVQIVEPGDVLWVQTDYLFWRMKSSPMSVPIVTTGDPRVGFDPAGVNSVNTAGALGQPGTQVLFGGGDIRFPAASGMRLTFGAWVTPDRRLGFEGSGFLLERLSNQFSAASNGAGSPPLYFPIFSSIAGAERGIPIADPLRSFSGNVNVGSTLQLWNAEGNALCALYRGCGMEFDLLVGVRCMELNESLQIRNTTKDLLFGNVATLNDSFRTSNLFYGGQIGGRFAMVYEWVSLTVTGKVAGGSAHQTVGIQGDITQFGPNPLVPPGAGTFPGGIFSQTSNIGRFNANPLPGPLMVLPSLEVKVGFQITHWVRAFAGYDVLYWGQVLRPGNQINHNVNLSQNAVLDPNGAGTLVGPAQPSVLFGRSDFWAQGISLGIEMTY